MVDKNPLKIQKMFNEISNSYDFLNNIISFGLHSLIKKRAIKSLNIQDKDKILDLCTGTGDITHILKKISPNSEIIGVDFSPSMLEIAQKRFQKEGIIFKLQDVCNLDFKDNMFDLATISFGLRNIEDKEKALNEINRVLKNNGIFAHLDFSNQNKFFNFIFDKTTFLFSKFFSKNSDAYKYLIKSKNEFEKPNELIKKIENSGFEFVSLKTFLFGTIVFIVFKKK